jgi:hypothetical protein
MKYLILMLILISGFCVSGEDIVFNNGFEQPSCNQAALLNEDFNISDQLNWTGLWQESGKSIELAEIINNEGRLVPLASNSPYSLARIYHPLVNAIDVEVTFSFEFENATRQGVGVYVRSNGGHLVNTNPVGQGYAVFIERFSNDQSRFGLWYEHNGIESVLTRTAQMPSGMPYDFLDETKYQVKFQVFQEDMNNTRLRAKIWRNGNSEPTQWHITTLSNYTPLQNTVGGVAVDSFNTQSTGSIIDGIRVDDIVIKNICPL